MMDTLYFHLKQKPGVDFNFETRNSLLLNDNVKFTGVKIGLRFGKKFRTGISYNWLRTKTYNSVKYFYDNLDDTTRGYFKMGYWSIYMKFVYHKTKRWEYSVPLQFGWGSSWIQEQKNLSFKNQMFKRNMLVYEPTVSIQYKLLKFLALSTNLGYRFVWHHDKKLLSQLNGPIYVFNISFLFDQFFFEAFPESAITQKFGPAEW
ncbi:MAG: hypothetical protein N2203_06590 [Bacteroidia bacterium]|nr:hypothetical protein [Bacteroidia bacterium]